MDLDIKELIKAASEGLNLKDFKGDVVGVKVVENQIGNIEPGGIGIQNVYTNKKSKTYKQPKKVESKPAGKPKTLQYFTHGNKGVLRKQQERVTMVFRMLTAWEWIDGNTNAEDFDSFFEGMPRHCNITWKANSTVLTILLQELLKQPYITKQTGVSAKSLVEQQFEKTANSDRTRLDDDSERKIKLVLIILNINNPLAEEYDGKNNEDIDKKISALMAIYEDQLRSTKGI